MWGWTGDPDPMSLLGFFTTDQIASGYNDCFFSSDRYDELFKAQQQATSVADRKADIAEMQQIFYDYACYHILYYDSVLDAQRTDKFTGWTNQPPASGTPFFGYGYPGYMTLTDAHATPTAGPPATTAPGATAGPATPAPSATPVSQTPAGDSTPLLIGGAVVIVVIVVAVLLMRGRGKAKEEE